MKLDVLEKEVGGKKGYIKDVLDFDIAEVGVDTYRHTMIFKLERRYKKKIKDIIPKGIVRAISIVSIEDYGVTDCKFYNINGVEVKSLKLDVILEYVVLLDVRTFINIYKLDES